MACPLRFYFHSVARLERDDEISEEVDAPMFGTILHAAVQKLYARIVGESHPGATLRALLRTKEVARAVEESINENYLNDPQATSDDYTGNLLLVKDIVTRYLRGGVMPYDASHDGFAVQGLEQRIAIVGLAKRIEEVYFPHDPTPYYLDRNGEALKVLMHIRDEAHRFGITFHRKKRSLAFIKSELESIPTLGSRSVEKLLQHFHTLSRIRRATEKELTDLIGHQRATAVLHYFAANASKPDTGPDASTPRAEAEKDL